MAEAKRMGRPPKVDLGDPEVVNRLCERLIAGSSMAQVCAADDMPAESTVYLRMAEDEEFRSAIARAREAQQEAEIDRTVDMADAATAEDHQVVKLRIWARQWRAAKLAPKKYGDSQTLKHADADGEKLAVDDVSAITRLAALAAKYQGGAGASDDAE